ncbi:crossover junction endodeoxyribonuclease RuvC [Oxalobacter sp. OttesenSCG-928-P03]|nr:crossover junction endodeoxyribonuclease RuvC [Oxalobacter sp. OttesenSCG-928-P03]
MRILGIDPGLRATGFGMIEKQGAQLSYIASGTVHTPAEADLPDRLKIILKSVTEIIETYRPDCAAIEKVFVNVNPQSTLLLGQARGAAICALVSADLAISEYTALQVKQAVVGHGKAQKKQVQEMVKRLLSLPSPPKSDAADALGVAICHANAFDTLRAMQQAATLTPKSGFRIRRGRLIR